MTWISQLVIASYYFYRFIMNLVHDRQAAALTLTVYVSSVGFLCGFSTLHWEGKPLSHLIYILVLYLSSVLDARGAARKPLFAIPGAEKYVVLLVLFFGSYLDELPLFAYALPVLIFPNRFLPSSWTYRKIGEAAVNSAFWCCRSSRFCYSRFSWYQ